MSRPVRGENLFDRVYVGVYLVVVRPAKNRHHDVHTFQGLQVGRASLDSMPLAHSKATLASNVCGALEAGVETELGSVLESARVFQIDIICFSSARPIILLCHGFVCDVVARQVAKIRMEVGPRR